MLLESGRWLGRGSMIAAGSSRGAGIHCEVLVQRDESGATLSGSWRGEDESERDFVVRLASNEEGTYTVSLRLTEDNLQGTAKLDSPPNLGLLWNDSGSVHATFALFAVTSGFGFRGFVRDAGPAGAGVEGQVYTWEMAFSLKQDAIKGDNVVSLHKRRR